MLSSVDEEDEEEDVISCCGSDGCEGTGAWAGIGATGAAGRCAGTSGKGLAAPLETGLSGRKPAMILSTS